MAKYTGKNISSFEHDVDKIRARPTQYVGVRGDHMVFTIWREVFDNAVDEAIAGRNNHIHIVIDGQRISVIDKGHGFPTEERMFKGRKVSALTIALTELQAGGKMNDKAYETSRGTHGVGVTATNALSTELKVWTTYRGKVRSQLFKCGKPKTDLVSDKLPTFGSGKHTVKMEKKGTAISFIPDLSVVGKGSKLNVKELIAMCDQTTYLNPKLTVVLTIVGKGTKTFRHKNGIKDYLANRVERLKCTTIGKPCVIQNKTFDVAFQFSDSDGDSLFDGFTNSLPNTDGGVHVDLFRTCLYSVLQDEAGARAKPFKERDLREGFIGLIDWKLSSPEFSSQTKEKLIDSRVKTDKQELIKALEKWAKENKSLVKEIIARAGELSELKNAQLTDRRALKALKTGRGDSKMPSADKLSLPSGKIKGVPTELFMVEGNSAGGTARFARFLNQGVLKLKGKILNVVRDTKNQAFAIPRSGDIDKNEVLTIMRAIGFDPNKKDKAFDDLRFDRYIILVDPDPDGGHISTLLLALKFKFMQPLIDRGLVYVARTAQYYVEHKGKRYYGDTHDEVYKQIKDGSRPTIRQIKGWGEVSPELLREVAFDPTTRRLIQIKPLTSDDRKKFTSLMDEDTQYRRQLLRISDGV